MAEIITLPTHSDDRGDLTVIEKLLPFEIKRVFFIYNCDDKIRGGHSHRVNRNALVSVNGSCEIVCGDKIYYLDTPDKCLILNSDDYHIMSNFKNNCVLLVLNSDFFDKDDYVTDESRV